MSSNTPVPDVAVVHVRAVVAGKPVETSLWFRSLDPPINTAKLTTIATRVRNNWVGNFRGQLASGTLLTEVQAVDCSIGSSLVVTVPIGTVGGFQGPTSPTNIALCLLNLPTASRTPHSSRNFIYAVPVSKIVGNTIDSVWAAGVRALWDTNNRSHRPFGWAHVSVSLFEGGVPRTVGVSADVNFYQVRSLLVSSQRRRLTGRPS